jgi:hypothetical protein
VSASAAPAAPKGACPSSPPLDSLGAVAGACSAFAATSKDALPADPPIVACEHGFEIAGCKELRPPECGDHELAGYAVDQTAYKGPLIALQYVGAADVSLLFVGPDGKVRFAAGGERSERCEPQGFRLDDGRFVMQEVEHGEGRDKLARISGPDSYPNKPLVLPGAPPRLFSTKLEWFGGQVVKTVNGKHELTFASHFSTLVLVEDTAFALVDDKSRVEAGKPGATPAPLIEAAAGTEIVDFSALKTGLAWLVKKGGACELVTSPFASAKADVAPTPRGAAPCKGMSLFAEHVLVGDVLVRLSDGRRATPATVCKDAARCADAKVLSASATTFAVVVHAPEAIELVPLGALFDAASAAPPAP